MPDNKKNILKERLSKLKSKSEKALQRLRKLGISNQNLKDEQYELVKVLTQTNEILEKAKEGFPEKEDELTSEQTENEKELKEVEDSFEELEKKVDELEVLNQELVTQNEELKKQVNKAYRNSLAILGTFAGGFWLVSTIKNWIKAKTTGQQ